jgi:hypothetical protein
MLNPLNGVCRLTERINLQLGPFRPPSRIFVLIRRAVAYFGLSADFVSLKSIGTRFVIGIQKQNGDLA